MGADADTRVLVVTGARKGIGRFLAEHYVARGYAVVGCSREMPATDDAFTHERYLHVCADVCDEAQIKGLFATVKRLYGRLDVVLNNAGIASMNHALLTPMSSVERVLQTNVAGSFLVAREGARLMQRRKFGRIVNFASVATPLRLEGEAVYAASKAAVVSLTQILAREFAPFGITVNAVGPTPIRTDLIRGVSEDKLEKLMQRQAISRMGEMRDVANVVDFLVAEASDFVTAQTIYLGGVS